MLDLILPGRCLNCGLLVSEAGSLCIDCWKKVRFLGAPCCDACGYPFEYDLGQHAICAACAIERPPYRRARSVFIYDDHSSNPILSFKHSDRLDFAPVFARWMARSGQDLLKEADMLAPVPLHWTRLFHRRYNQAALLAWHLGKMCQKPVLPEALQRRRRTESQGRKSRQQRQENLRGAFAVNPKFISQIHHKKIVLIDDVLTTGATGTACAKALLRAGAHYVDILTLARIVRPGQMP